MVPQDPSLSALMEAIKSDLGGPLGKRRPMYKYVKAVGSQGSPEIGLGGRNRDY